MLSYWRAHPSAAAAEKKAEVKPPADRVVVMYFHRTQRCPTCLRMGSYSEEAVVKGYPKEIKDRTVEFHYIDFQDAKNAALTKGYKITGPALVVVKVVNDKPAEVRNLEEIWTKNRDKDVFLKYVRDNVTACQKPKPEAAPSRKDCQQDSLAHLRERAGVMARSLSIVRTYSMATYALYAAAALYLGLLTSISPCPLATNIAAISYIGRKVESPRRVLGAGVLYTLGRCILYLALAALLAGTALSIPTVAIFLQKYMHMVLGPVFLILGMFLVGLITRHQRRHDDERGDAEAGGRHGHLGGACCWASCSPSRSARRRPRGSSDSWP